MTKLLIYFIVYLFLLSILIIYFKDLSIRGINITKNNIIVFSLAIPFLLLMQWSFETLFDPTGTKSIVLKTIKILFSLALIIVLLFFMIKELSSFITKTLLIALSIILVGMVAYSIPRVRENIYIRNTIRPNTILSLLNNKNTFILFSLLGVFTLVLNYKNVVSYFLMPKHKVILKNPVYLQKEITIGTTEHINMKSISETERKKYKELEKNQLDINYNYAISASIYLNPQPLNTRISYNKFTKLFDFGMNPAMYFNTKTQELKLEFYVDDNTKNEIIIKLHGKNKLLYQKWNTFILNVKDGVLDLFINGTMIHHQQISNKYKIDKIIVGENRGINGGIKNVVFYNTPLKLYQIHYLHS